MKNNSTGFAITALYIFLMLTLFPVPTSAQNNFTNKLDSMGFSPSMMDFYNYYTNGLTESHITIRPPILIMDDIWSYPDDRKREFDYDDNQNLVSRHIFKKTPEAEVWEPQQQQLYTHDETNLFVSGEFREWDETNSSWDEDPFEGYYNTFNDDGLIIQKLWKSSLYSDDYVVQSITENTYNVDNNLSQIHFRRFSPTSGLVIYEQYSYYEYLANGNVEISVTKRESDSGPFVPHEVIDEEYVDFNTIQTITRFNDGQPYLDQRITKYESFLGDYGGQRNEDYVDGSWEIQFERIIE